MGLGGVRRGWVGSWLEMGPVARRRLAVSIVEAQAGVVGIVATPNNCRQEFARNFLNLRNEHRSQLTKFKFTNSQEILVSPFPFGTEQMKMFCQKKTYSSLNEI